MEKQVKKTFLPQDIAVLAAVFAAGAACILTGLAGVGGTILLCGAMMLPFYRHGFKVEGHKGLFRLREISVCREDRDVILAFLEGKPGISVQPQYQGGALVDVYWRKDGGPVLARYFDYAEYTEGVEYPLHEISREQFDKLLSIEPKIKT